MQKTFLAQLVVLMACLICWPAQAAVSEGLRHFFQEVETYSARFHQVVLDAQSNPIEESSGRVLIERPGKFLWVYETPNEYRLISNGEKVWTYDVALDQVTVRSYEAALGDTPAGLLAGGTDIEDEFTVTDLGQRNGSVHWVRLAPKYDDVNFQAIRIGFDHGRLQVMELVDGLGQTTRIRFSGVVEDEPIPDSQFEFTPPDGVDVIDETR